MREITIQDNTPIVINDCMEVGVYPYPNTPDREIVILDLEQKDTVAVLVTGKESVENCDAAVTENTDITIAMRTRDCAPVCLCDGTRIGLSHIGWQGFSLSLLEKTLEYFDAENLKVYVGPFLHDFEIRKDSCYDRLLAKKEGGVEKYIEEGEKIIFHFKDALKDILPEDTVFDTRNTGVDETLPSYRFKKGEKGFLTTVRFI